MSRRRTALVACRSAPGSAGPCISSRQWFVVIHGAMAVCGPVRGTSGAMPAHRWADSGCFRCMRAAADCARGLRRAAALSAVHARSRRRAVTRDFQNGTTLSAVRRCNKNVKRSVAVPLVDLPPALRFRPVPSAPARHPFAFRHASAMSVMRSRSCTIVRMSMCAVCMWRTDATREEREQGPSFGLLVYLVSCLAAAFHNGKYEGEMACCFAVQHATN